MHLRQEERQQLLHEGAGANVMTAFVEVIFDNSDGRLTVEGDEVVLRRTIGVKKDEFFLNRKRVTKQEVCSLLESAGFSRSNPYYIVQQGKVNMLTLMKDEQRLDLLKEVAGTKVYEERRAESLQIIQETNHKRLKIQEVVAYIDERLNELDEEKEELRAYQQLDKDRRALEYTLYDKELKAAREDLSKAEEARLREIERADDLHRRLHEARDASKELEERLAALEEGLGRKAGDRGRVEGEREKVLAQRERALNEEKALVEKVEGEEAKQAELRAQLAAVEKEVAEVRANLAGNIEAEYKAAKKKVDDLKRELKDREAKKSELHDKQGRRAAFRSVAERDAHLKKQQVEVGAAVKEREGLIRKNEAEREKALRQVKEEEGIVGRKAKEIASKEQALASLGVARSEMMGERNRKQDERKAKQERVAELEERKGRLEDQVRKAEQTLRYALPKHIARGLETVARVVEEEGIRGCYGPVYSLLTLKDPKFRQAVEVAAGNSLFNVVVDTDETAAKLMRKLEGERGGAGAGGGRVCFMPLNRLRVKPIGAYPDSGDVVPLLSAALTYPKNVDKAMQQIFGLKLLARDLEVAARFSEVANMDAITLDGDQASRKGSMQGGYHDEKNSKLAQVLAISVAKAELMPLEEELKEEERTYQRLDTEMSRLLAEMQKKEVGRRREGGKVYSVWGVDICRTFKKMVYFFVESRHLLIPLLSRFLSTRGETPAPASRPHTHPPPPSPLSSLSPPSPSSSPQRDTVKLQDEVDVLAREMRAGKQRVDMLKVNISKIADALPGEQQAVEDMKRQLSVWASELGTPLDSALSAADTRMLREIEARLPVLALDLKRATEELQAKASSRSRLTYRLNENLIKTREKILEELLPEYGGNAHVVKVGMVEARRLLEMKQGEVEVWRGRVAEIEKRLEAMDAATEAEKEEERRLKARSEEERMGEASLRELVADVAKGQEKLLNKRSMALQKRDASLKKIQELGSLPAAELELYKTLGIKQLYKRLHECNDKLKQYRYVLPSSLPPPSLPSFRLLSRLSSQTFRPLVFRLLSPSLPACLPLSHVNKKALDQYVNFSEQREELLQRKAELDDASAAIEALITNLDRQKDEVGREGRKEGDRKGEGGWTRILSRSLYEPPLLPPCRPSFARSAASPSTSRTYSRYE